MHTIRTSRAVAHYILAALLLTVYGTQVCPMLDTLSLSELALVISFALFVAFMVRMILLDRIIRRTRPSRRPRVHFRMEMSLFLCAGMAMAVANMVIYSFPFDSGLKLLLGTSFFGFFAAMDAAVASERRTHMRGERYSLSADSTQVEYPIARTIMHFSLFLGVVSAGILTLVMVHDVRWILNLGTEADEAGAFRTVIIEIIFALVVLVLYILNVINSYARNMKVFLDREIKALNEVAHGHLNVQIPVDSQNEFGVIARYTNQMISRLKERTDEVSATQEATILALASLAETRDNETGRHLLRTQRYVRVLAQKLRENPRFQHALDDDRITMLYMSAPLHDIGKVGVPDSILLKPGKLTAKEFDKIKKHTISGRESLRCAEKRLGKNSFLALASEIAYTHHEKWDGTGYPCGIKGAEIPLSGRIMAVADVYDALITKRVYKPAFSHKKAREIILEGRGKHFDPDIVDGFIECELEFQRIAEKYTDHNHSELPPAKTSPQATVATV